MKLFILYIGGKPPDPLGASPQRALVGGRIGWTRCADALGGHGVRTHWVDA
jgi:hypothetical protein